MKYHLDFDIDFKRNEYKGMYIVFEGIDASGKTTQLKNLKEYFIRQGKEVVETTEPTREGYVGELIHKILQKEVKIPLVALQYLFSADRAVNHFSKVIPALKAGKIVLSSRSFWSAIAYGILDREEVDYNNAGQLLLVSQGILSMYHQFILPDFSFYIDISPKEAMKRIHGMEKEHEIYEKEEKLEKIKKGYDFLLSQFPNEITRVDGKKGIDEITKEVVNIIKEKGGI